MKFLISVLLSVTLFNPVIANNPTGKAADYKLMAYSIKAKFDALLSELDPDTQRHYAQRMYRISGDTNYIKPIRAQFELELRQLQNDLDSLNDSKYLEKRIEYLLEDFNRDSRKGKARYWLFKRNGSMIFDLNLLYIANNLHDAGIETSQHIKEYQRVLEYLKTIDFRKFLLDEEVIEKYSAQAVNNVYYLYNLDLSDLREKYAVVYRQYYGDKNDLGRHEFRDKIYGLTHFIIAASDYYQHPVSPDEFNWIFDYFHNNSDRILNEATADIIAEVGLCYLLTHQNNHPVAALCQNSVIKEYDEKQSMILSPSGNNKHEIGEHRNILAYMLLNWPEHLNRGPQVF